MRVWGLLFLLILASACTPVQTDTNTSIISTPEGISTATRTVFVEGELINFATIEARDPDGDPLQITYSDPVNSTGQWQTKIGDAGTHTITITATDGVLDTIKEVTVDILPANLEPVIENFEPFAVNEGEEIYLQPIITDPENDDLTVTYSGWLTSPRYQTTFEDAGKHKVLLSVTDGYNVVEKVITITVLDLNRPPVFEINNTFQFEEGDLVSITPLVADPDGDIVSIKFGKPLNENGKWQTKKGDAGKYNVLLTISDGTHTSTKPITITVGEINQRPVLEVANIRVKEGELIDLNPVVSDPDEDEVMITVHGWMNETTYQTTFEDAGVYDVTIRATDGIDYISENITVTVDNVNRPPVFVGSIR